MKLLFTNPLFIAILVAIGIIYFLLAFQLSTTKKFNILAEAAFVLIFSTSILDAFLFPLDRINPVLLALPIYEFFSKTTVICLVLYIAAFIILRSTYRYFFKHALRIFKNPFLGILLVLLIASTLWSQVPDITLRASLIVCLTSGMAAHIASRYIWTELSGFLRWSNTVITLASIFYAIFIPSKGILAGKGWQGVLPHPNSLGPIAALNAILWGIYLLQNPKHPWLAAGLISLSLLTLKMTSSTGALIIFLSLSSLVIMALFLKKLSFKQAAVSVFFIITISIFLTLLIRGSSQELLTAFGKDASLSGRTDFWPQLIEKIEHRPILGYGHRSFWLYWLGGASPAFGIKTSSGFVPFHAHNGFLDLTLDLGLVGFSLFVLSYCQNIFQAVVYCTRNKRVESIIPLVLLLLVILRNTSESKLLSVNYIWFYYILLTVRLNIDLKMANANNLTKNNQAVVINQVESTIIPE